MVCGPMVEGGLRGGAAATPRQAPIASPRKRGEAMGAYSSRLTPSSRLARRVAPQRRLRGGEAGDRHAEGRAGDVVEADGLAERDRGRIAAVLAADAELDARCASRRPRSAAILISSPTPSWSRVTKGSAGEDALARCRRRGSDAASSREMPSVVCVRSLVPKEKNSARLGDLAGAQRSARQLDHRADLVGDASRPSPSSTRLGHGDDARLDEVELGARHRRAGS